MDAVSQHQTLRVHQRLKVRAHVRHPHRLPQQHQLVLLHRALAGHGIPQSAAVRTKTLRRSEAQAVIDAHWCISFPLNALPEWRQFFQVLLKDCSEVDSEWYWCCGTTPG